MSLFSQIFNCGAAEEDAAPIPPVPAHAAVPAGAAAPGFKDCGTPIEPELPKGWRLVQADDGSHHYTEDATGRSTRNVPVELDEGLSFVDVAKGTTVPFTPLAAPADGIKLSIPYKYLSRVGALNAIGNTRQKLDVVQHGMLRLIESCGGDKATLKAVEETMDRINDLLEDKASVDGAAAKEVAATVTAAQDAFMTMQIKHNSVTCTVEALDGSVHTITIVATYEMSKLWQPSPWDSKRNEKVSFCGVPTMVAISC